MEENKYNVNGHVLFPLNFETKSNSENEALKKAELLFNKQDIIKVEIDVYTQDGKCHLIIADKLTIYWTFAEKIEE